MRRAPDSALGCERRMRGLGSIAAAGVLFTFALSVAAQSTVVHRIGYLTAGTVTAKGPPLLFDELRRLGHIEGRNLAVERRHAAGRTDRLDALARELVALKVHLIIASATPAVQAAQRATSTIPVVFAVVVDPVGAGLVASLSRPGANVTGVSLLSAELSGKRLELLQEVMPKLARVAVLANPTNESNALQLRQLQSAAKARGVSLQMFEMSSAAQTARVLDAVVRSGADALIALDDQLIAAQRAEIAAVTQSHGVATATGLDVLVEAGFLIAYGPSIPEHFRRVAAYADKVLKGARPSDLPVEQPAEFELIVNMKTARALGLAVPNSVLLRANRIID